MNKDRIVARSEIYRLTKAITAEEQTINTIYQRIGQNYFAAHHFRSWKASPPPGPT